jgi:hypothetical protein
MKKLTNYQFSPILSLIAYKWLFRKAQKNKTTKPLIFHILRHFLKHFECPVTQSNESFQIQPKLCTSPTLNKVRNSNNDRDRESIHKNTIHKKQKTKLKRKMKYGNEHWRNCRNIVNSYENIPLNSISLHINNETSRNVIKLRNSILEENPAHHL